MALVALLAGAACQPPDGVEAGSDDALASGARERALERVEVEPVVRREMVSVLETTTEVESEDEIQLFPRAMGIVSEILVEEGDRVEQGAILARLDPREQDLAVRDAEVALQVAQETARGTTLAVRQAEAALDRSRRTSDQAERDYQRDLRLFEGTETAGALSEKALEASALTRDQAAADYRQAELDLERRKLEELSAKTSAAQAQVALDRARLMRSFMDLTAPIDGIVAQRAVRVGDSASSAAMAFVLTDPVHLRAVIFRPQRELALFRDAGKPSNGGDHTPIQVRARAEAIPGAVFRGTILRTSPTVDRESGSFRVTAAIEATPEAESGPQLLPGMLVRLELVTERHPDALVVPKRALRREGENAFVFVVEDGRLRRIDVEEGFSDEDSLEILPKEGAALEAGALVVTVGSRELEDGERVQVHREGEEELDEPAVLAEDAMAGDTALVDAPETVDDEGTPSPAEESGEDSPAADPSDSAEDA